MASSIPGFLSFLFPTKPPQPDLANSLAIPSPATSSVAGHQAQGPLVKSSPRAPRETDPFRSSDDFDLSAVICPSLAHSNTLFFASPLLRRSRITSPMPLESSRMQFQSQKPNLDSKPDGTIGLLS
ncbi:hypothetical protein MLD38_013097 [Melastoma candidum]|uniref:Uncharacterized protein n=1 Tax=Melastoma candidum TaxID=119954 RepID=A0ACB9R9Q9_9MYRT|nr:hypothetical protein MLD38_013097 [Melastoma candidum]